MVLFLILLALLLVSVLSSVFLPVNFKKYSSYPLIFAFLILHLQYLNRTNFITYILPVAYVGLLIVATFIITKKSYIWIYSIIPAAILVILWYYYRYYAGVINPQWPLVISTLALVFSMLLTNVKKIAWKIAFNCILLVTVIATMIACLPTYTCNEARDLLSEGLGKIVSHTTYERRSILRSVPALSLCVDYLYVFEVVENDSVTTYGFNPETGEWSEWYTKPIN